eukprot:GHVP01006819.1.p1 GENE.GHVP01006819.1~~GHVP01006819.1.p1  ORF type:complete len:198 (-),score=36.46 GHVP01006819.1:317-910(-)
MKSNLKTEVKDAMACAFLTTVHGNLANSTTLETTEALSFSRSENISANDDLPPCTPCTWTKLPLKDFRKMMVEKSPVPSPFAEDWAIELVGPRLLGMLHAHQKVSLVGELHYFEKKENLKGSFLFLPPKIFLKWNEQEATIIFEYPGGRFYGTTFHPTEDPMLAREIQNWIWGNEEPSDQNWTISGNEESSDYEELD